MSQDNNNDGDDPFAAFNEQMTADDFEPEAIVKQVEEFPIETVNPVDEQTVEIVVNADGTRVTTELTPEEATEYREAFGVDSIQEFEGHRVTVVEGVDGTFSKIGGPAEER